jgi:hypothetical protein
MRDRSDARHPLCHEFSRKNDKIARFADNLYSARNFLFEQPSENKRVRERILKIAESIMILKRMAFGAFKRRHKYLSARNIVVSLLFHIRYKRK